MTINYDYDINSTNYNPATTTFYWRVVSRGAGGGGTAGVVVNDFDTSSGSTLSGGNTTTIQVGVKEQTGTQGTRNFTLEVSTSATFASNVVTKDFQVTDGVAAVPVYTIQGSDPLSINETASASTITVNTTNVPDSTVLYWNITTDAAGTTEATTDWQAYNSGGTGFTITSNTGNFTIDATADAFDDPGTTETFYLHVRTGSDTGTSVDSIELTVNDDSLPASPTYTIQGSDPLTVSEVAAAQTITVNTTNVTDGTFLYWNITTDAPGTTEATTDWQAYNSGGTGFEINSNTGNFTIDATADAFTDGTTETFYLHVRTGSDAGTSVDSIQLNVTDDSQTPAAGSYNSITVSPSSITEGGSAATFTLNTTGITNGTRVGFIVYDTSLDPQPFDTPGTGGKVNSTAFDTNPPGHTWYGDLGGGGGNQYHWSDDGSSSAIVWNGTTIATGFGVTNVPQIFGSYEYERGPLIIATGLPQATYYCVRRRLVDNTGVSYINGEFEMSYDGVSWGGAGQNITQLTGSYNAQYHGAFTVNSNTDTVQFRALNEGTSETGESVKLALWVEDDNALSTGNLTSSTLSISDPAASFSFDPTFVRHRRFTNNPFLGCTTNSQIDFLRNGSTSIQSTGFGTENVADITPSLDTANNWSSTQNSTFGDNYQILFQVYSDSGLTTLTTSTKGSVAGDAYEVQKGGVTTAWSQSTANTWVQLNDDVRLQGTRVEGGTGDGSGAGSSAITNYVKYTIKQYSGVLGTGTTVLTGSFEHKVEASDGPS